MNHFRDFPLLLVFNEHLQRASQFILGLPPFGLVELRGSLWHLEK